MRRLLWTLPFLDWMFQVVILLAILSFPSWADLSTDLVLHWAFEDNLEDSGAGNHDATLYDSGGAEYWYEDGIVGRCIHFNNGDYVQVDDFSGLDGYTNFSICFWLKRQSVSAVKSYSPIKTNAYGFIIDNSDGEVTGSIFDNDGTQDLPISTDDAIENTNWNHIAMTHDGTTVILYVNGNAVDTDTPSNWSGIVANNTNVFRVGFYETGAVDEVRLYSRALSGPEVSQLADQDNWTPTPTVTRTPTRTPTRIKRNSHRIESLFFWRKR